MAQRPGLDDGRDGNVNGGGDGGGDGLDVGSAGSILARRARPGSRAIIGGLLVAAAAVIVFAAALSAAGGGRASYAVAARPLAAGSTIGPGDLTTNRLELGRPTASGAWHDPSALIGRTVRIPVEAGELIQSSMLGAGPGPSLRPVSIPVDPDSLVGLSVGQPVDALETASSSSSASSSGESGASGASGAAVSVVVRGAALWSIGHSDSGLLSGGGTGNVVVTLGVADLNQAEALITAAHSGTVELVLAEPEDGTGSGSGSS